MHCNIIDKIIEIYHNKLWRARGIVAVTYIASVGITVGVSYLFDFFITPSIESIEMMKSDSLENKNNVGVNTTTVSTTTTSSTPTTTGSSNSSNTRNSSNPSFRGSTSNTGRSTNRPTTTATTTAPPLPTPPSSTVPNSPSIFTELWNFKSKPIVVGWTALAGILTSAGITAWEQFLLTNLLHTFNNKITYENIYTQIYHKEISLNDEFTIGLGKLVVDNMSANVNSDIIQNLQRVEKSEFSALQRILKDDISHLRRRASPDYPTLSPRNRIICNSTSNNDLNSIDYIDNGGVLAHGSVHRNARTSIHPRLHVHFSPSTNTSPITTKEMIQKKRSLRTHFPPHNSSTSSTGSSSNICCSDTFTPAEAIMQAQEIAAIIAEDAVTAVIEHDNTMEAQQPQQQQQQS